MNFCCEIKTASRTRDYINHLESQVSRESGYVEQMLSEQYIAELWTEAWIVVAKTDTVMLKSWLKEASKF